MPWSTGIRIAPGSSSFWEGESLRRCLREKEEKKATGNNNRGFNIYEKRLFFNRTFRERRSEPCSHQNIIPGRTLKLKITLTSRINVSIWQVIYPAANPAPA
jgi:hypothetical protein